MIEHQKIIEDLKKEYEQNPHVLALFVTGSAARGEAVDGNDLDILIVTDGEKISKEYRVENILVEVGTIIIPKSLEQIEVNPMFVYMYLDAKAVFDRGNYLEMFQNKAKEVLKNYKPSDEEKKVMKKWLSSVVDKIHAAKNTGDMEKASFCAATNLWKTVEGIYLINSMPTPASTSAQRRIKDLEILPDDFENIWKKTLLGNLDERIEGSLKLMQFVLQRI